MRGYVNFTLATSPYEGWLDQNKTECRYRAFRDDKGHYTPTHWKILALKFAFVIIFEVMLAFFPYIVFYAFCVVQYTEAINI